MLSFNLGLHKCSRQPQTGRFVGEGTVLAETTLHLSRRRHQAGRVIAGSRQPVQTDAMFDTPTNGLGRDLSEAM